MIRRLIVALVALLIAAVGGVATYLYASNADSRAMARMDPVQVLVVAEPIAEGTPAESISRSLTVAEIPSAAVVPGGVVDLSDVAGLLTVTDLQVGEQLLASRFVAPEAVPGEVEVPADMHLLTIELEPRRVIGGELHAGDTVGFFVSATDSETSATHLMLHKVLVTDVRGGVSTVTNEDGSTSEQAAAGSVMVTLALSPADAERVVFASEFATIWLSLEGEAVPEAGTQIVTIEEIFQ
ncbi:pilus assembly protein CpaB [Agrococcus baldri]|uniref:Pilus assembly protein CpaB n=1 Tax=Agrococcus baldri TaxID=153730 RepID=A0AA94KYG8_9MICO|nr:RcpC/CpaB family pilus assembly protein [Agrococcus baldri]SFR98432.1 pilus assembly protein CpaB [Agrococcus baldri]